MLVGKNCSVRRRILNVLGLVALACLFVGGAAYLGKLAGLWEWPPRPSSALGVGLGLLGAALIFFEMLLTPRKMLRGYRLGPARLWLKYHVYAGLVVFPIIVLHTGFAFGGPLPAVTFILFLIVILSGVWGLLLQQWLPNKLLAEIPGETIATEADRAIEKHRGEARRITNQLAASGLETERNGSAAIRVTVASMSSTSDMLTARNTSSKRLPPVVEFLMELLDPYLARGRKSGSPLASPDESARRFARLRSSYKPEDYPAIERLEELADLRRRWDRQRRMYRWLHAWLVVHIPLSVLMTILMVVHAFRALKFW